MITAEKSRGNPSHRSNPGNPGEGEAAVQPAQEGITPLAADQITALTTNYSVTPNVAWVEFTNPASITLSIGLHTVTGHMPPRGGGEYMTAKADPKNDERGQPLALLLLDKTVPEGGGLENTGMSIEGFPGLPEALPNTTAMPTGVGFHKATINTLATPPTVTIDFQVALAATIPAGKRWILFSMTGV